MLGLAWRRDSNLDFGRRRQKAREAGFSSLVALDGVFFLFSLSLFSRSLSLLSLPLTHIKTPDSNPGAVQKQQRSSRSQNVVDQSYVGHSQPLGSSVEGGAYDAAGRLADPAAAASAAANPAMHGGGGSMFVGVGSGAAQEVAAATAAGAGKNARLAWDPKQAAAASSATAATAATAAATTRATSPMTTLASSRFAS